MTFYNFLSTIWAGAHNLFFFGHRLYISASWKVLASKKFAILSFFYKHFPTTFFANFVAFHFWHAHFFGLPKRRDNFVFKSAIKSTYNILPFDVAFFNFVKPAFHFGCERHVHNIREIFFQKFCNRCAKFGWRKHFCFFLHICTIKESHNCWRISCRSANAFFFHSFDKACLGVS